MFLEGLIIEHLMRCPIIKHKRQSRKKDQLQLHRCGLPREIAIELLQTIFKS
ncbi:hypothetical protein V6Z11_A07G255900 [Gossypium hirsutum]